jgi:hypothetical protein
MSSIEPPSAQDQTEAATTAGDEGGDDSIVSPPAYPAYSTPPPEGLHTGEDG